MRISDWSSDVCSDDLLRLGVERLDPSVRVIEVGSLAALKDAVRRHPETKLVLLDLMMPDVEGLASLQYLRGEWPDVRVAVISSLQDRAWIRSAEALGAIAFIPKSTPAVQMQKILDSLLTNGHRSEEHTSELQSLMRIPYAVFCLKKKKQI